MIRRRRDVLAVSEAELARATAELKQRHDDTFPAFQAQLAEWAETARSGARRFQPSRRTFLLGAGAMAGGAVLAACGSGGGTKATGTTSTTAAGTASLSGDSAIAGTAASLENLAVAAYTMGLSAAAAGKLGTVPPAVATFATTAKAQHTQHAQAFNAVLSAAGKPAVTKPDPALLSTVEAAFNQVHDVTGLAKLALELENVAANTYMGDLGQDISSAQLVAALATIQPVERQHVAILYYALGEYPVPETFQSPTVPAGDAGRPSSDING